MWKRSTFYYQNSRASLIAIIPLSCKNFASLTSGKQNHILSAQVCILTLYLQQSLCMSHYQQVPESSIFNLNNSHLQYSPHKRKCFCGLKFLEKSLFPILLLMFSSCLEIQVSLNFESFVSLFKHKTSMTQIYNIKCNSVHQSFALRHVRFYIGVFERYSKIELVSNIIYIHLRTMG